MSQRLSLILVLSSGVVAGAQSIDLRGTVTSGGQPVSGAIVTLLKSGKKDTTGSDGTYAFSGPSALFRRSSVDGPISLSGGVLEFDVGEPAPVAIEVFDTQGNRLKAENLGVKGAGHYRRAIAGEYPANRLLIVRVSVGDKVATFRHMPWDGGHPKHATLAESGEGRALAKTAAVVDTLEATASGFSAKKVMVESYEAKLDVSLDRVDNGGDKWGGLKNPPGKSAGCGKPAGITGGKKTITVNGASFAYNIGFPADYDPNTASLLVFIYHWVGGTPDQMTSNRYYGLQPMATAANKQTLFIAPNHHASQADHAVFDALLALMKANACIDTTRVFSAGYSHGGMMTYSLSTNHQKTLRAGAGIAPANYNVYMANPKLKEPMAWYQITGMGDETCRWINNESQKTGAKFIALEKAADNGCTLSEITTWKSGDPKHVTFEFSGCKPGYPVVVNTFNGPHGGAEVAKDPGASTSWVPKEIWEFFMRF
jgi:poly(3-hydroxybutyrate) depolymerase